MPACAWVRADLMQIPRLPQSMLQVPPGRTPDSKYRLLESTPRFRVNLRMREKGAARVNPDRPLYLSPVTTAGAARPDSLSTTQPPARPATLFLGL
jgi:hypothetical protein